jgi:hypothetical protein
MEFIGFVILVLGLIGASLLRRHLREDKQLKLRQIIHDERMKAMEHSQPLPDAADIELARQLSEPPKPARNGRRSETGILWVRIVALCIGLTTLLGGIGMTIGFAYSGMKDLLDIWSVGLIPAFVGLGLLIFYRLSRNMVVPTETESES